MRWYPGKIIRTEKEKKFGKAYQSEEVNLAAMKAFNGGAIKDL